jgi:drug/metabolite transporter (DMT)-like permease
MFLTWRTMGVLLFIAGLALVIWAPNQVADVLHNFLALGNLAIFVLAALVLAWFLYAVFLRRILRARRIANARMKRLMREAHERFEER